MITELLLLFLGRGSSQREPTQENRVGVHKLESTFLDSSHGHCGHVCRTIVLVEEHSSCQLSSPNPIDPLSQKINIVGSGDSVTLV